MKGKGLMKRTKAELVERVHELERENTRLIAESAKQPRVPPGYISMDEARRLAATYDGGEGRHPLARHRDSMG